MGKLLGIFTSNGGVPKTPVNSVYVQFEGISGDDQNDNRDDGGKHTL